MIYHLSIFVYFFVFVALEKKNSLKVLGKNKIDGQNKDLNRSQLGTNRKQHIIAATKEDKFQFLI